ncbi:MAG: pallilysin-related adhesin [Alkalispirochaeta sp.]
MPEASEGIALSREGSSGLAIQGAEEAINPRVELPDEMLFISAQDANLDIDEPEEQIVVVKRRDDPEDRIRIVVADFDTLRNTYRITWEGKTLATNIRTFAVSSQDLIGDHVDEIVGVGTDRQGRQTMDVFRRQQDEATATGIAYERIFSVATDGSIEIASQQRSDSYRTLQSNGRSFPIDVYRQNRETETPLDLIMTRWTWNVSQGRYIQSAVEPIPAMQIEEERLRVLYDGEAEELEQFITGPWFRSRGESMSEDVELAYFDPESREVVLFHEDRQERYEWMNSYKTLYAEGPGLWMNLRNDVLSTVRLQLSLTILGVDTMQLSVDGAEYWNGSYQRMTSGIQSGVLRRYNLNAPSFVLDGVYTNENDVELLFNRPFFHLRTPTIDWSGGYNLVEIGEPVLELKVVEYGEVPEGVRVREDGSFTVRYMIEYGEFEAEGGQIRRILLTPVRVTVDGLEPTSGPEYSLEQVPDSDT